MRRPRKTPQKLTVFIKPEIMIRIGQEKYETGITIEEIVNRRLILSFEAVPNLEPEPAKAAV